MRVLAAIGALAIVIGIAAAIYFFGGFYSVAATAEEPAVVGWILERTRMASVSRHAQDQPPASINDPAAVQAGAKVYASLGCAACHGAPGVMWQKFSEGMHPDPPNLKEIVAHRSAAELFFVVRNGIRMTGMPSFTLAGAKDEDIWAVVAFLKKLPSVSEDDYRSWTAAAAPAAPAQ